MIKKIISGGQTGADQAALDAAIELDIPHGGWVPKGRLTENGVLPDKYKLHEMPTSSYSERTERNIIVSDGTLILSHGKLTGGSELTQELADKNQKHCLHIDLNSIPEFEAALKINKWIGGNHIEVLNVAGPRASKDPKIYQATIDIIESSVYIGLIGSSPENSNDSPEMVKIPRTIHEAVQQLISGLPLKDKAVIANMPEEELYSLHYNLGKYIRNNYELWGENSELMEFCRKSSGNTPLDPNDASSIIIKALWEELRKSHKLRVIK